MSAPRRLGWMFSLVLLVSCAEPGSNWRPTRPDVSSFPVAATRFVSNKTKEDVFYVAADGSVVGKGRKVAQIERSRIIDTEGHVLAELHPGGEVTFPAIARSAKYEPAADNAVGSGALAFGDDHVFIMDEAPEKPNRAFNGTPAFIVDRRGDALGGHFVPYDRSAELVDEVLVALLLVKKEDLLRSTDKPKAPAAP